MSQLNVLAVLLNRIPCSVNLTRRVTHDVTAVVAIVASKLAYCHDACQT